MGSWNNWQYCIILLFGVPLGELLAAVESLHYIRGTFRRALSSSTKLAFTLAISDASRVQNKTETGWGEGKKETVAGSLVEDEVRKIKYNSPSSLQTMEASSMSHSPSSQMVPVVGVAGSSSCLTHYGNTLL